MPVFDEFPHTHELKTIQLTLGRMKLAPLIILYFPEEVKEVLD